MVSVSLLPRRARTGLAILAVCAAALFGGASVGKAQMQESGTLDRITHPDRTLHFSGADREFAVSSSVSERQAVVKPFAFSHGATLHAGDGVFSARAFTPKDKFRTQEFSTHAAQAKNFAQTDKAFGTKAMDVKEDRAANKAMPISTYAAGEKPFLGRGKRQDTIDDLRKDKNMTIDQVRELLNKSK